LGDELRNLPGSGRFGGLQSAMSFGNNPGIPSIGNDNSGSAKTIGSPVDLLHRGGAAGDGGGAGAGSGRGTGLALGMSGTGMGLGMSGSGMGLNMSGAGMDLGSGAGGATTGRGFSSRSKVYNLPAGFDQSSF